MWESSPIVSSTGCQVKAIIIIMNHKYTLYKQLYTSSIHYMSIYHAYWMLLRTHSGLPVSMTSIIRELAAIVVWIWARGRVLWACEGETEGMEDDKTAASQLSSIEPEETYLNRKTCWDRNDPMSRSVVTSEKMNNTKYVATLDLWL